MSRTELEVTIFEVWVIAIFGLLVVMTLIDATRDAKLWHSYSASLITLSIAAFVFTDHKQRMKQIDYSRSLTEIVESGLRASEGHIHRVKSLL